MKRGAEASGLRARIDELELWRVVSARLRAATESVNPSRRGAVAMLLVALLAAVAAGVWVAASQPRRVSLAPSAPTPGPTAASTGNAPTGSFASALHPAGQASSSAPALLVVDVVGKVRRPGVYRLAPGSRVEDAVRAAGGAAAGANLVQVNLARRLADGEQLAIGIAGAAGPVAGAPGGEQATAGSVGSVGPLDLNTATAEQLDGLPGVGPVLAERIVDWRTQHGRFGSVTDLNSVSGIGETKYADLRQLVRVS